MNPKGYSIPPKKTMETMRCYQQTAALKGAVDLDLFTAIDEGHGTVELLADRCRASPRGIRILCDYLVIAGFLSKDIEKHEYALTAESTLYLSRRSPAYLGTTTRFLTSPGFTALFEEVAEAVRHGGTVRSQDPVSVEHSQWIDFAQGMRPLMRPAADFIAQLIKGQGRRPGRVLDLAAGHGLFGITIAKENPEATVVALDWPSVLSVARENAVQSGVEDRYQLLPGNALEMDFGDRYDLILITNFLHHFDPDTCVKLMSKAHQALAPEGRVAVLEFVPNEDRISPPEAAAFSLTMLVSTPTGDTYTFRQFEQIFALAGFHQTEGYPVPEGPQQVLLARK